MVVNAIAGGTRFELKAEIRRTDVGGRTLLEAVALIGADEVRFAGDASLPDTTDTLKTTCQASLLLLS